MAEAAAAELDKPTAGQRLKYFCHECSESVEINADATSMTCPKCDGCFIEELTQELENDRQLTGGLHNRDPLSVLGRSNPSRFLSSMLLSLGSIHTDEDGEIDTDDDDDGLYDFTRVQPPLSLSQTTDSPSTSSRDGNTQQSPFHRSSSSSALAFSSHIRFLEQLLGNLRAGRSTDSSHSSEFAHGFPQLIQGFHGDPRDYAWGADGIDNVITELLNQSEGTGPPPATEEDIDILPSVAVTQDYIDQATQCSVCLEDFALDELVKSLPCEHIFHSDCVIPWLQLHRTCPICRKSVGEASDQSADDSVAAPVVARGTEGRGGSVLSMASSDGGIFQDAFEDTGRQPERTHSAVENVMDIELFEDTNSSIDMGK